jgi:hypothetical protein
MMASRSVVFVSDAGHLHSAIAGGVQVCTSEYVELLKACALTVDLFPVTQTRRILTRIKIKLGLEVYERYEFTERFEALAALIDRVNADFVALNQVALIGFAPLLRKRYGARLKIIVLSHGNESGDYLHEIVRGAHPKNWIAKTRDIFRLGALIYCESTGFTHGVDLLLCLSETELQINSWLGATNVLFIPRTFNPVDIGWSPTEGRLGFVGSLNHKPNFDGLVSVIRAVENLGDTCVRIRVVGGPAAIGKALQETHRVVEFVGSISDEALKAEASTWAIFLNPVFWYSRGASTKLATGMNWGIPVVSTSAGNRGYVWENGDVLTAKDPAEMASAAVVASQDKHKLEELALQVREAAASGPSMESIAGRLRDCLDRI